MLHLDSSFYDIGQPKKGEVIFVSAASGAVGQLVVQLAKHEGLTVIGSVGDDDKLKFISEELKCDHAFNYKKESAEDALKRFAPDGIDIFYDVRGFQYMVCLCADVLLILQNVGGETLDAALGVMKDHGRVVGCGMISQVCIFPFSVPAYR